MKGENPALITSNRRAGFTISAMLLAALGFYFAGIFLPFTTVSKLWLFNNQISVYHGLVVLWKAGELFLFLILYLHGGEQQPGLLPRQVSSYYVQL